MLHQITIGEEYFDMANKDKYDTKYELSKYNVSFGER